jgi:hypothetical protein
VTSGVHCARQIRARRWTVDPAQVGPRRGVRICRAYGYAGRIYHDDVSLLLGGLITLAVTAFVQIMIIPRVQQRNRRIERWEEDVVEIDQLLNEEIPMILGRATEATYNLYAARHGETPPGSEREEVVRIASEAHSRARKKLRKPISRASVLVRRARLVNRTSPYWTELSLNMSVLARQSVHATWNKYTHNREEIYDLIIGAEREAERALEDVRKTLEVITLPMKPPSGRVARWIGRRTTGRRHLPKA